LKAAFDLVQEAGDKRQELQKLEGKLDSLTRQAADAKSEAAGAIQQAKDWGTELPIPKPGDVTSLERQCLKLAERTNALAELSGGAQEYQEAEARVEHLAEQVADLEKAEQDLRELVDRLGQGITERFKTGFAAINQAFEGYFRQLFGGGKAMVLN
jgi:chromosome segregation ATPase